MKRLLSENNVPVDCVGRHIAYRRENKTPKSVVGLTFRGYISVHKGSYVIKIAARKVQMVAMNRRTAL